MIKLRDLASPSRRKNQVLALPSMGERSVSAMCGKKIQEVKFANFKSKKLQLVQYDTTDGYNTNQQLLGNNLEVVGMPLLSKFPVGLGDLSLAGVSSEAQDFVIVSL